MCRIAGIINQQLPIRELQHKVTSMCNTLQHGGPDDEGTYTNEQAGLCFGHRRLSLIDLSARGHQPMTDANEQVWITFNGEIYNYLDIKADLIKLGAHFKSDTDTEVIIQAYIHWGEASFSRLRGMFAFALYDSKQQLTYLVRDSSGIKPLYYCTSNQQLSFASEVQALKASGIATESDNTWQIKFLAYGHIPEPYTNLKHVQSLPKGSFLCWQHNAGNFQIDYYKSSASSELITNLEVAKESIKQGLKKAVNRQLLADAPVGVFLSGGLDSSLLSLLASQEQHNSLQYISIYFNENSYNERSYQDIIAKKLVGKQHAHLVTYQDFESCLPEIMQSMDMPTTDGINTWFISKYARQNGLKAVLSGLGADELFGGYPSFQRIKYINYLKYLPIGLFERLTALSDKGYKRISFLKHDNHLADYLFLRGIFTPREIAALLDATQAQIEQALFNTDISIPGHLSNAAKASWLETNLYMQNQLLRDTDVMSMSHGLEVRVPFLDEDFCSIVNGIVPELRFSSVPVKKVLIDSFKSILPEEIWNRPKMGFTFPLQHWMKRHPLIGDEHMYANSAAKSVIKKFNKGKIHWSKVFALYQLQQHA